MMRSACLKLLIIFVLMSVGTVLANPYSDRDYVTGKMVNDYLLMSSDFPRVQNYKGISAQFLGPELDIKFLDQKVKLRMLVSSTSGDQVLIARAVFDGWIEYYEFNDTIRFRDPRLDSFQILQDTFDDSKSVIRVIRQEMTFNFRDVVLFDVKALKLDATKVVPKSIEIAVNKLELHW